MYFPSFSWACVPTGLAPPGAEVGYRGDLRGQGSRLRAPERRLSFGRAAPMQEQADVADIAVRKAQHLGDEVEFLRL